MQLNFKGISPPIRILLTIGIAIAGAFAVSGILMVLSGVSLIRAYYALFYGAFGTMSRIAETLVRSIPLMFTGLAIAISFKCGFWNIGAEGQLILGAIAATGVGAFLGNWPAYVLLPLCIVAGFAAGSMWGIIPAALKVKFRTNEILTTLMLNFIAIYLLNYLINYPWRDPVAYEPFSPPLHMGARLPILLGARLHAGIFIAMVCALVLYVIIHKTILGYKLRVMGTNPEAAIYGGISPSKNMLIAMSISGGLAGLGGMVEISGVFHRLMPGFSANYGFMGIPVALLAKLHPLGIILSSVFFSALLIGSDAMQRLAGVPVGITLAFTGMLIIFILIAEYLTGKSEA